VSGGATGTPALCVLGSGSGGNCTALVLSPGRQPDGCDLIGGAAGRVLLVDLGLSPRSTRQRLRDAGSCWSQVTDVLLTHLDSDHFCRGWLRPLRCSPIRLHASPEHCQHLRDAGLPPERLVPVERGSATHLGAETTARPIALPHDDGWSSGWLIEDRGLRIGYATDLGRATPELLEFFDDLDAVLLESNYDPPMQLASRRPASLKGRIMGGRGHLSNRQALDAVLELDRRGRLQRIVLLHLSRQCNDPGVIRALWSEHAPHLTERLHLASQHVTTPVLTLSPRSALASTERFRPGGQISALLWE